MDNGRESSSSSRWPELATLRALARGGMSALGAGTEREPRQPAAAGWRGREDHAAAGGGKTAKVMHLLLWGPK